MTRATLAFALLVLTFATTATIYADEAIPPRTTLTLERVINAPGRNGAMSRLLRRVTGRSEEPLFARPYGVAWDGDALVVADPDAGRVVRIDPTGRIVLSALTEGEPIGVAVCEGRTLVTDARLGRVYEFDRKLRRVAVVAEGLHRPTVVACAGGVAIVAETGAHCLVAIAPDGSRREIGSRGSGLGEFNFPIAVATRGDEIFAGDAMNFRIQRGEIGTGQFTRAFGGLGDAHGDLPRLKGIAIDASGALWVTDAHLDEIAAYGPDGRYLASIAGPGGDDGGFSFPAGIAISASGSIAVADSLNRRVLVFATHPAGGSR